MICKTYPLHSFDDYKYVVVLSWYRDGILLSRHRARTTWETQGGHIEYGETPAEAARRELFEESGAVGFDMRPLCDYRVADDETDAGATGVVFTAAVHALGTLPESEMAETQIFARLPENLTYPDITPVLFAVADAFCRGFENARLDVEQMPGGNV